MEALADQPDAMLPQRKNGYRPPDLTPAQQRDRENADLERARSRTARGSSRRRGALGGSRLGPAALLKKSSGVCYLCSAPLTKYDMHIEHIIPIAKGGTHTDENLAAACATCNSRKDDKIVSFHVGSRRPTFRWVD